MLILFLIGCCLATNNKQNPREAGGDDVTEQESKLACDWPRDGGEITLSTGDRKFLTKGVFETFSECVSLSMDSLGIEEMKEGVFSTMKHLKNLFIRNDKIEIRAGIFEGLENLGALELTNMSIYYLPDNVFINLGNLHSLFLQNNPLTEITADTFYGLTSVEEIRLDQSNVVIKPGLFRHNKWLKYLNISDAHFTFTENMWAGVELTDLYLGNAGISDLSVDIWRGLEGSLKYLSLSGNHFETIPHNPFQGLNKLQALILKNCALTSSDLNAYLWGGLGSSLRYLYLDFNHFPNLRAHSFRGLAKLGFLKLGSCGIEHITAQAFEGLEALGWINFESNPLVALDAEMFGTIPLDQIKWMWFGCDYMSCFPDLCWIYEKMEIRNLDICIGPRVTKCGNYDGTVIEYLENEC